MKTKTKKTADENSTPQTSTASPATAKMSDDSPGGDHLNKSGRIQAVSGSSANPANKVFLKSIDKPLNLSSFIKSNNQGTSALQGSIITSTNGNVNPNAVIPFRSSRLAVSSTHTGFTKSSATPTDSPILPDTSSENKNMVSISRSSGNDAHIVSPPSSDGLQEKDNLFGLSTTRFNDTNDQSSGMKNPVFSTYSETVETSGYSSRSRSYNVDTSSQAAQTDQSRFDDHSDGSITLYTDNSYNYDLNVPYQDIVPHMKMIHDLTGSGLNKRGNGLYFGARNTHGPNKRVSSLPDNDFDVEIVKETKKAKIDIEIDKRKMTTTPRAFANQKRNPIVNNSRMIDQSKSFPQTEQHEHMLSSSPTAPSGPPTVISDSIRPLHNLLTVDVDNYLANNVEKYDELKKKWTQCSLDVWSNGAEEMSKKFQDVLDLVKTHMSNKLNLFATLHNTVSQQQDTLSQQEKLLRSVREKLVHDSGNVLNGFGAMNLPTVETPKQN